MENRVLGFQTTFNFFPVRWIPIQELMLAQIPTHCASGILYVHIMSRKDVDLVGLALPLGERRGSNTVDILKILRFLNPLLNRIPAVSLEVESNIQLQDKSI